jgi:hypothetical protein
MFERTDDFMGGSLQGECLISPARLVEVFGEPDSADDYKVSGEFTFVDRETGEHFTLYDWKHTTLYDYNGEPGVPTPAEFWASTEQYPFHIGGKPGKTDVAKIAAAVESLEDRQIIGNTFLAIPSSTDRRGLVADQKAKNS